MHSSPPSSPQQQQQQQQQQPFSMIQDYSDLVLVPSVVEEQVRSSNTSVSPQASPTKANSGWSALLSLSPTSSLSVPFASVKAVKGEKQN